MITCCNVSNEYGQRKPNPNGGWMDGWWMVDRGGERTKKNILFDSR